MFVRTQRLTLRPGWIEDAPQVARAIAHWDVCSKLATAPWPYALGDAEQFLAMQRDAERPVMLIHAHEGGGTRLIGGIGIHPDEDGEIELGYWLTPDAWGRGYATEGAAAAMDFAADRLGWTDIIHTIAPDNPSSQQVARKLGARNRGPGRLPPPFADALVDIWGQTRDEWKARRRL